MVHAIPDVPRATRVAAAADRTQGLWCVLRTWGGREFEVSRALDRQGVDHYLPYTRVRRIYRKRKVVASVPLFAGYVFATVHDRADDGGAADAYDLSAVKYVSEVMRVPAYRQARLARDIENVRALADMAIRDDVQLETDVFVPGRPVRIFRGPYAGLEGEVITRRGVDLIQVGVLLLGQCLTRDVDPLDVEPLEFPASRN